MVLLSTIHPALPVIVPDVHPQDVCEMLDVIFPDINWKCVSFDDTDDDFMLAESYSEDGAVCVEIRTGQPFVLRSLRAHEAIRW